jgi:hypothetical protein
MAVWTTAQKTRITRSLGYAGRAGIAETLQNLDAVLGTFKPPGGTWTEAPISIGTFASATAGSGIKLSDSLSVAAGFYADDGGVASGSGTLLRAGRFRTLLTYTGGNREQEVASVIGQIVSKAGVNRHNMCGVMGSYEVNTSLTVDGQIVTTDPWIQAAIIGRVGAGSAITTINTYGILAGLAAMSNTTSFAANSGKYVGLYVGKWASLLAWDIGVYMPRNGVVQGIRIGDFVSAAALGSAILISAATDSADTTQRNLVAVYGESATDLGSGIHANVGRFRHLVGNATLSYDINHETYGLVGQLVCRSVELKHLHSGLLGTLEANTTAVVANGAYAYSVAAVIARVGGTNLITATKPICGFSAVHNGAALASGSSIAYAACATSTGNWTYLLGADNCDNFLYAATGIAYEHGVKIGSMTALGGATHTASGLLRVVVNTTTYYIPLYAVSEVTGE